MTELTALDRQNIQTVLTVLFDEKPDERKKKNVRISTRLVLKLAKVPSTRTEETLDQIKTVSTSDEFKSSFGKWIMTVDQVNTDNIIFMQP